MANLYKFPIVEGRGEFKDQPGSMYAVQRPTQGNTMRHCDDDIPLDANGRAMNPMRWPAECCTSLQEDADDVYLPMGFGELWSLLWRPFAAVVLLAVFLLGAYLGWWR